jgi:hypothetical protein
MAQDGTPRQGEPEFPSLRDVPPAPCGWLQWKGTDACMDVHCACGANLHFDDSFLYFLKCGGCGQVYEVGGWVKLYPLAHEPAHTKVGEPK